MPRSDWTKAVFVCNKFNQKAIFGRAYLETYEEDKKGVLFVDSTLLAEEGVTEDALKSFIRNAFTSAKTFFEFARNNNRLY